MKINSPSSYTMSAQLDTQPIGRQAVSPDDVNFFSATMDQTDLHHAPHASGQGVNNLFSNISSMFNNFNEDKKDMNMALRKASRSIDPLTLTKVDGKLSNYYLESSLNAKIVSKTVQGLEKLTNLQ